MDNLECSKAAKRIYQRLIKFYPKQYRQRFEDELMQTFSDMYKENQVHAWIAVGTDLLTSVPAQYATELNEIMQNNTTVRNLPVALIGAILTLPLLFLFIFGILGHTGLMANLAGHSIALNKFIYLALPAVAVLLNLGGLIKQMISAGRNTWSMKFVSENWISLAVVIFGGGLAFILAFHDTVPCLVHGIQSQGFQQFNAIWNGCRGA